MELVLEVLTFLVEAGLLVRLFGRDQEPRCGGTSRGSKIFVTAKQ